jgi:hypothetical protein
MEIEIMPITAAQTAISLKSRAIEKVQKYILQKFINFDIHFK